VCFYLTSLTLTRPACPRSFLLLLSSFPLLSPPFPSFPLLSPPFPLIIKVVEVNNDQSAADMDMEVSWSSGHSPPGASMGYTRKLLMGAEVRGAVKGAMAVFEQQYLSL